MTEHEYEAKLARIYELMDVRRTDAEELEIERLVDEVEAYEKEHYPI